MKTTARRALSALPILFGLLVLALGATASPLSPEDLQKDASFVAHFPLFFGPAPPSMRFEQGVAAGDVTSNKAILWTRGDREAQITLEVAEDADFRHMVIKRSLPLLAEKDFIARVAVDGLSPGRVYY